MRGDAGAPDFLPEIEPTFGGTPGGVSFTPSPGAETHPGTLDSGGPGMLGGTKRKPGEGSGEDDSKTNGAPLAPPKGWASGIRGYNWWDDTPFNKTPPAPRRPEMVQKPPLEVVPPKGSLVAPPKDEEEPVEPSYYKPTYLPPADYTHPMSLRAPGGSEPEPGPDFMTFLLQVAAGLAAGYLVYYSNLPYILGFSYKRRGSFLS